MKQHADYCVHRVRGANDRTSLLCREGPLLVRHSRSNVCELASASVGNWPPAARRVRR